MLAKAQEDLKRMQWERDNQKVINEGRVQIEEGEKEVRVNEGIMIGNSDAKMVLEEVRGVLSLESNDDPVLIIDTVRKLAQVVKAVPRLESFINNISRTLSEDPQNPVPLEQVIPRVGFLRDLEL